MLSEKVAQNRNTLMDMIGMVEEISRTNNKLHQTLTMVMHNPDTIRSVQHTINELYNKIEVLKSTLLDGPFVDEETIEIPRPTESTIVVKEKPIQRQQSKAQVKKKPAVNKKNTPVKNDTHKRGVSG